MKLLTPFQLQSRKINQSICINRLTHLDFDDPWGTLGFLIHGAGCWTKPYDDFFSSADRLGKVNDTLLKQEGLPSSTTNTDEATLGQLRLALSGSTGLSSPDITTQKWIEDGPLWNPPDETFDLQSSPQSLTTKKESIRSQGHVHEQTTHANSSLSAWISWIPRLLRPWTVARPPLKGDVDSGPCPPNAGRIDSGLGKDCAESSQGRSELYFCKDCEEIFSDQPSLKLHRKTHCRDYGSSLLRFIRPFGAKKDFFRHAPTYLKGHACTGADGGSSSNQARCGARGTGSYSNQRTRNDKGKRPLNAGNEDDLDDESGLSNSPRGNQPDPKRPKSSKPRLICPFHWLEPAYYNRDHQHWHDCEMPGFIEFSHLTQHLRRKHQTQCSLVPCLPPSNACYEDSRVPKWRAECQAHCHPDSECAHNPYNDGTENPIPLYSSLSGQQTSQVLASSRRQRNHEQINLQRSVQILEDRVQSQERQIQSQQSQMQSQQSQIQSQQSQIETLQRGHQTLYEHLFQRQNLGLRSQVRHLLSGELQSRPQPSAPLQSPRVIESRMMFGGPSLNRPLLAPRGANRNRVLVDHPAPGSFAQSVQPPAFTSVDNLTRNPFVQDNSFRTPSATPSDASTILPQNDPDVGPSTAPTLTRVASTTETTGPRTDRQGNSPCYVISGDEGEQTRWTHGEDAVAGNKRDDNDLSPSDYPHQDEGDNNIFSYSTFLRENGGDDNEFLYTDDPNENVGDG